MRKWMLVCAVVSLLVFVADAAQAQEPAPIPATVISSTNPTITTVTPRTGPLQRVRARREATNGIQPVTLTTTVPQQQTQNPMPVAVQQAPTSEPTTIVPTTVVEGRQGLFSRLRNRR